MLTRIRLPPESWYAMFPEVVMIGVIVIATAILFAACCIHIARAAFGERPFRTDVKLALYWTLAFIAAVIGCLALTDVRGNSAAALYAAILCAVALTLGYFLSRSWRVAEERELSRLVELRQLVDHYRTDEDSTKARCARAARTFDLTRREEEMLGLLLEGRTRSEIARDLYVSGNTVKTHLRNLYRKMGVTGKDELVETLASQVKS